MNTTGENILDTASDIEDTTLETSLETSPALAYQTESETEEGQEVLEELSEDYVDPDNFPPPSLEKPTPPLKAQELDELFTLDDFTVTQEHLATAKKYSRLTAKKEYEVIIEDIEVLVRDLENSDDPQTRSLAQALIRFYQEYRADPQDDPTAQEAFVRDYLAGRYRLPWLIPIVRDVKKVYKRQLHLGEGFTILQTKDDIAQTLKEISEFDRNPVRVGDFLDAWFNYQPSLPTNTSNILGSAVLRQLPTGTRPQFQDLELRESIGERKSYEFIYKKKGRGKDKLIIGKEDIIRVQPEKLQLIGFAQFPLNWPSGQLDWNWSKFAKVNIFPDATKASPEQIKTTLRELIPDVNRLLEQEYNFQGVTSLPTILKLLEEYGHPVQSLTAQNKETIAEIIGMNLENQEDPIYERRRRVVISQLEDEMIQSSILSDQLMNDPAMRTYDLQVDPLMNSKIHRFLKIVRKADVGRIWTRLIRNQSVAMARKKTFEVEKVSSQIKGYGGCPKPENFQGDVVLIPDNPTQGNLHETCLWDASKQRYLNKKEYLAETIEKPLFAAKFEEVDIDKAIRDFRIIDDFKLVQKDLLNSFANLWLKTKPDPSLLEDLDNPLDALWGLKPEARDKEAWVRYFKKSYPDAEEKNYYYKGKWIGCQHEYDRLYQAFEDSSDSYPIGKRYSQIQQNNGVVCGFCGEELQEQDDLITQGYDSYGRKINTYDNPGLVKIESSIQQFFRQKSEPVLFASTKVLDPWNRSTHELPEHPSTTGKDDKEAKNPQKYEILKRYQTMIQDATFQVGLEQDPNKLPKTTGPGSGATAFLQYLLQKLKITKVTPLNAWFIERLNPLFSMMDRTYELVIRRMAVLMVSLNWWLMHKEAQWLNTNVMLNTWTPQLIGQVFMSLNFQYTQMVRRMKDMTLEPEKLKKDIFWEHFQRDFKQSFRSMFSSLNAIELENKILEQYRELQKQFLYVQNVTGDLFNGNYPLEHEVIRIFNEFLTDNGRQDIISLLKVTFNQYWDKYLENPVRMAEVEALRQELVQTLGTAYQLKDVAPGLGYVQRSLYQRYLAQEKQRELKKLQQLYLDLINDNVYEIQDELDANTSDQLLRKKMYYLGKLNCEDWSDLPDLAIVGLDSEAGRMEEIMKIRIRIASLEIQPFMLWEYVGSELSPDYRKNTYTIYETNFKPPVIQVKMQKFKLPRSFYYSDPKIDPKKLIDGKNMTDDLAKFYKELNYIKSPNIPNLVESLGDRVYLKDLKVAEKDVAKIINGQYYDGRVCQAERAVNTAEFEEDWKVYLPSRFHPEKAKILAFKKYIISYVRHYVELFSHLRKEDWGTYGLTDRYLSILKQDKDEFQAAFENFQVTLENEELEKYVDYHLDSRQAKEWPRVIQVLQYILIHDLSIHLRRLRIESAQYVKGKTVSKRTAEKSSRKTGATATKARADLNSYEIFQEFLRILFKEIEFQHKISNVDWDHKEINQTFNQRSIWDKQAKIKSQDSLDWKILRFQLSVQETEEAMAESGPNLDSNLVTNETDMIQGNEMDFDLGDDGNDIDEAANDYDL